MVLFPRASAPSGKVSCADGQRLMETGSRARAAVQLGILATASLAATFAFVSLSPVQEDLRLSMRLTDSEVSVLQGPALAIPFLIFAVPAGIIVDRLDRARFIKFLFVIMILGSSIASLAPSYVVLLLGRCLVGMAVPAINVAVSSLIADLYPPTQRGRAGMFIDLGQYLGLSSAFAIGGWMILSPVIHISAAWQSALASMSILLLPIFLMLLFLREPTRGSVEARPATLLQSWRHFMDYRRAVMPVVLAMSIAYTIVAGGRIWASPSLVRLYELSPANVAAIMAVIVLISSIGGPLIGGILTDASYKAGGARRTLSTLGVLSLCSVAGCLFTLSPGVPGAAVMLLLLMVLSGCILLIGGTLILNIVPNELRGISVAILGASQLFFGVAVAPLIVSGVSDIWKGGAALPYALTGVNVMACLLAGWIFLRSKRHFPISNSAD